MRKSQSNLTSEPRARQYQRFAEQFVELIVDPKQQWMVQYILTGGLDHIPTDEEIESGEFAFDVLQRLKRGETKLVEVNLYEALTAGDREMLVPYTKKWAMDAAFSDEEMRMFLKIGRSSSLRQSFKVLSSRFRFRRGATTKLAPGQYHKVLKKAEDLRPAIEKVLTELAAPTAHTLPEILKYCKKDYPEACKFLLSHVRRLQLALNNERVTNRARKRISARARVLADAMAGTEHNLAFSTSIERVREARRLARRQNSL